MAIQLQNSVFIHIPKTGGRWVKENIMRFVPDYQFIGDPIYDAHKAPDTDLPVFAFVRHPLTMANSLWHHRSRKRANKRAFQWDWQQDVELERVCGTDDYTEFFRNIAEHPGILTRYFEHWYKKYDNHVLGRMEFVGDDLCAILYLFNEKANYQAIRANKHKLIGHAAPVLSINPTVAEKIMANEAEFCEYHAYSYSDATALSAGRPPPAA